VSKGFLIFAQNTTDVDYVRQAYALALSIKYSQRDVVSVSIVTNNEVDDKYRLAFANIISIPWITPGSALHAENRWKLYHVSPYAETIVLDADMLLLEDVSSWWSYCNNYDLKFCSKVSNYKLEEITDTYHRTCFIANKLTNPYTALHYFKKSPAAYEFYKVLEFVCNNWEWCYSKFAPEHYQNWLSLDLAAAIAVEITGMHAAVLDNCSPLEFIHMKPPLQNWSPIPVSWQDTVPSLLTSAGSMLIGNIKQSRLLHYVEKSFITDSMISKLEKLSNGA
jgi:hypothetical protein